MGQLASNGDCLYATTVARQIKVDYPDCHLTWAIASAYRSILAGNPDVDEMWEIEYYTKPGDVGQWMRFEAEAKARKEEGDFDEVFLIQIAPPNFHLWTGSVRAAILGAYPRPITVDKTPIVRLSDKEVENVRQFAERHRLVGESDVILFECAPRSEQSLVNPQFALKFASEIGKKFPDTIVILSSNQSFVSPHENIVDGSVLSLRENAELTKYCSLLIGASSGVSWIATSDWARPLPMIQLVVPDLVRSNSVAYDYEQRNADPSELIEMHSYSVESLVACVETIVCAGFPAARSHFHQKVPLKLEHYRELQEFLMRHGRWQQAWRFLQLNIKEHGFQFGFFSGPVLVLIKGALTIPRKITVWLKSIAFR